MTSPFLNAKKQRQRQRQKLERYPAKAGLTCTPAAVEVFGRVDENFSSLIVHLAAAASARDVAFGLPSAGWRRRWEESLSITVQRSLAQSFLDVLGSATSGPNGFRD